MRQFKEDPAGLIPPNFATPYYQVIGFKIFHEHLFVMVKYTDTGETGQCRYPDIISDFNPPSVSMVVT